MEDNELRLECVREAIRAYRDDKNIDSDDLVSSAKKIYDFCKKGEKDIQPSSSNSA